MKKVLFIVGPTAVGKTDLSLILANKYNGEIISGDSMQIYCGLDVGTNKILPSKQQGIKHHLIDIKEVTDRFSISDFKNQATIAIDDVLSKNKLPIVVGGTGFYLQSLIDNLCLGGETENDSKRDLIRQELSQYDETTLRKIISEIDPNSNINIPDSNLRRLRRVIEFYRLTGKVFSKQTNLNSDIDPLIIGLNSDREDLYDRINIRVNSMMSNNKLESEARWLFEFKDPDLQAKKGIGYQEWPLYFEKKINRSELISLIQRNSRRYAKRQITWFKNKMNVNWFESFNDLKKVDEMDQIIKSWQCN